MKKPVKGPKDDDKKGKKSPTGQQLGHSPAEAPVYTTEKSPIKGKQASFFADKLSDLEVTEGMESCLVCHVEETMLNQANSPKFFSCFHADKPLNVANEFIIADNDSGSHNRRYKPKNDQVEVTYNTNTGQLKIFFQETPVSFSGSYRVIALNDNGDHDETSGSLKVLRKYKIYTLISKAWFVFLKTSVLHSYELGKVFIFPIFF